MRLLWLSHYSPWPPYQGGKIRTTSLVRRLAQRGDDITIWCTTDEAPCEPEPRIDGVRLRFFQQRARRRLAEKLAALASPLPTPAWVLRSPEILAALDQKLDFDTVVVDHAHSGAFWPEITATGLPWLFDAANVENSVMRQISRHLTNPVTRARFALDASKFRNLEANLVRRAAATVAVSAADARALEALHPGSRVAVHQSGVDLSYFRFVDHRRPSGANLLLTGTLAYYPNLDACRWLVNEIMPKVRQRVPGAILTLVGGPVPAELEGLDVAATGVRVVGPVPDVRPYLEAADLFVIPLRLGGGIRLKALEALSSGVPIVATPLAIEGIGIEEKGLALLAGTADTFASEVERGLNDLQLRSRLVQEGRKHVEEHYDWDRIAVDFRLTLQRIAR